MNAERRCQGCYSRVERYNMGYLFLTGATGLLGSYLVRDLLRAGVEPA